MGATNCPETPRQKMIQMMYIVYTAMLALNVSAEVLAGFKTVGDAINVSNIAISEKVTDFYNNFEDAYKNNPEKTQESWDKAKQIHKETQDLLHYIDTLRHGFFAYIQQSVSYTNAEGKSVKLQLYDENKQPLFDTVRKALIEGKFDCMTKADDTHGGATYFLAPEDGSGFSDVDKGAENCRAAKLKKKILDYKSSVNKILGEDSIPQKNMGLMVEGKFVNAEKDSLDWENFTFNGTLAIADMVILARMKGELLTLENDVLKKLFDKISANDFKFDKVTVISRPTASYIIQGGKYETRVNIGAYDSRATFTANVNGSTLTSDETGSVVYTAACTTPGEKKVHGTIYVKKDNGPAEEYEFDDSYFVAPPVAVVALTKMNVVYAGIDNPVSISVPGVDSRNVIPVVAEGAATISKDPSGKAGDYIINASKMGKIKIRVDAKMEGGGTKTMGEQLLRAKKIPAPVLKIGTFKDGDVVDKNALAAVGKINAIMDDFDFQLPPLKVSSFEFQVSGSNSFELTGQGNTFNPEMISRLKNAKKGQKVYIDNVVVKTPDGQTHKLKATYRLK